MRNLQLCIGAALVIGVLSTSVFAQPSERDEQRVASEATRNAKSQQPKSSEKSGPPNDAIIDTLGEHKVFADQRGTLIVNVFDAPPCLLYTVAYHDKKGGIKNLKQAMKGDGWFVLVNASDMWVFDGSTAKLIQLTSDEESDELKAKTVAQFPAILSKAPKQFVDRLPAELRKQLGKE
jgi:hypothetical protein